MQQSIRALVPIFLGFVGTHALLIADGVFEHADRVVTVVPVAISETRTLAGELGWFAVIARLLRA
jgi:hypothetical protein